MTASAEPLAIYVHVPFCRRRCSYCHFDIKVFHPRTDAEPVIQSWLEAVCRELNSYAEDLGHRSVHSIFFGGGTPSRLPAHVFQRLIKVITESFRLDPDPEISMEVNPEDVSEPYLQALAEAGINRLSVGVQTFHDPSLTAINRLHSSKQATEAVALASGFAKGVSLDLILGLPYQNEALLMADLGEIALLDPQHLSLYMLERDLPTPLDKTGLSLPMPDEDDQAAFYDLVSTTLDGRGYQHYEISNFAKAGFRCRHNLTYWTGGDYLGVGPAAHGRLGSDYRANHPRLGAWLTAVSASGRGVARQEHWQPERLRQERIIGGLRLAEGIPAKWLNEQERKALEPLRRYGLVTEVPGRLCLTHKGRLLANEVFQIFVIV